MTWHEFETAFLWFSLGLLAAPFWRLMAEEAAERRRQDRALALVRGLCALATLPPLAAAYPKLGPVCPRCGFYPVGDMRLERSSLARAYPCEHCLNGALPGTIIPHPSRGVLPPRYLTPGDEP